MSRRPPPGRRRLDASVPAEYDVPTRVPRIASPELANLVMSGVFVSWVVATAAAATAVVDVGAPSWLARPAAAALMVVFTVTLVHRAGGHMRLWVLPVVALGVLALTVQGNALLASAAVVTAVTGAVASVMITRPAASTGGVIFEYLVAIVAATTAMIAVAAWNAEVNFQRFNIIVLAGALVIALGLVWSLGAGLHGLGAHNLPILIGVAVVLVLVVAYSSIVRTYGSETLIEALTDVVVWMRENIGGVPRPVEVFLGFPALVVGISLRAKRRDGWWVLVFAVVGTAVLANSLVSPDAFPSYIGLSALYSVVLGLVVGLLVRHQVVPERSARAARQFEEESRVEPGRFAPLR